MQTILLRRSIGRWWALGLALTSSLAALAGSPARPTGAPAPAPAPAAASPLANLSGVYYVGSGTSPNPTNTYPTLTAAAADYNAGTLTGPVTFLLLDAIYSTAETFPIVFNSVATASATNTLTIKPNTGVNATITGSVNTGALIRFNGADFITLDGSNTAAGTTRNLTIRNTSTTTFGNAVVWITAASATNAALSNTVRNCILTGTNTGGTLAPQIGVMVGGTTVSNFPTAAAAATSNNTFQNNLIANVQYGMFLYGLSATTQNQGNVITGNQIGQSATNSLSVSGVQARFENNLTISGNTIAFVQGSVSTEVNGVYLLAGTSNVTVNANNINNITYTGTSGYGGRGVQVASGVAASNITVSNNFISAIGGDGWSALTNSAPVGIYVTSSTGGVRVVFNSVNMVGSSPRTTPTPLLSAALGVESGCTNLDVRNNILSNSFVYGNNVLNIAKNYAFYSASPASAYTQLNNNDYFVSGPQGVLGFFGAADRATLTALQTATGQDANSINSDPGFFSATDLHTGAVALNNAGTPITGITTDIDGIVRNTTTPDIGASEFTPVATDLRPVTLTAPSAAAGACYSATEPVTVQIQNNGLSAINFATNPGTVTVVVTPPTGLAQTLTTTLSTGTLASGATQSVTLPGTANLTAAGTYSFAVTATVVGDQNTSNDNITTTRANVADATLPYAETFSNGFTLPANFTTTNFFLSTAANNGGPAGSNGLRVGLASFTPTASATTPLLGPTVSTNNQLTFDARFISGATGAVLGANDKVEVQVSVCGGAFTTVYTINSTTYNGTGTASASFFNYSVPLTGTSAGQKLRVRLLATWGAGNYNVDVDNINVVSLVPTDLAASGLVAPSSAAGGCYGTAETVTVQIRNTGSTPLNFATNPATVSLALTGPGTPGTFAPVTLNTGTLAVGATQNVTFAGTANLSTIGTYSFAITATVVGDQNPGNDNLTVSVANTTAASLPYLEQFNTPFTLPTGFTTTNFNPNTAANNGGPAGSSGLRVNLYIGIPSATATTPILGPTLSAANVLTFDARFTNYSGGGATTLGANDKVEVQVSVCGGAFTTVYTINNTTYNGTGTPSTSFYNYSVPLTGTSAGQKVQVRLLGTWGSGDYYVDVDNINVVSLVPTDLAANGLVAPAGGGCYGTAETVTVQVRNAGFTAINFATNPATITGSVTGPTATTLTTVTINTGTLAAGATQNVTFPNTANLLAYGTYTFNLTATVVGDGNPTNNSLAVAPTLTVAAPVAGVLSAGVYSVCAGGGGTATLTLRGFANGNVQYQTSSSSTGPWTNVAGATSAVYTTPALTSTVYYRAQVSCNATTVTSNVASVGVSPTAAATITTPVVTCTGTPATLRATLGNASTSVRFFTSPTGGTALTSTTTGTLVSAATAALAASTQFYAEVYTPNGYSEAVGKPSTDGANGSNSFGGGLAFTTTSAVNIQSVTVYVPANSLAGSVTVQLFSGSSNSNANLITSTIATIPANPTSSIAPVLLTLNFAVPGAGQYTLYAPSSTVPLYYDFNTTPLPVTAYPYTSASGAVSITSGYNFGTSASSYYFFYNWQVGKDCVTLPRQVVQVNVSNPPTSGFMYPNTLVCAGSTSTVAPTMTPGATAGTFSIAPATGQGAPPSLAGITIDPLNGTVSVTSAAVPGNYIVTNTVTACATFVSTATFTVTPPNTATFSYDNTTYCQNAVNPVPTLAATPGGVVTGTPGGTFSAPSAVSIDPSTGAINVINSTPGTYSITYSVSTLCGSVSSTQQVTILATPSAAFAYLPSTGCTSTPATAPAVPFLIGSGSVGTFSATPAGLSLNPATGAINLAASTPGTYTVINTVAAAGCGSVVNSSTFVVLAGPAAPILSAGPNPQGGILLQSSVTTGNQFNLNGNPIAGATGQTYVVNSGKFNGTYTVTIGSANGCTATSNAVSVNVTATAGAGQTGASLAVYPNPTRDGLLTLELSGYRETVTLRIVNTLGQRVFEGTVAGGALTQKQALNLSSLPTGVYLLQATTASGSVETRRIVRE